MADACPSLCARGYSAIIQASSGGMTAGRRRASRLVPAGPGVVVFERVVGTIPVMKPPRVLLGSIPCAGVLAAAMLGAGACAADPAPFRLYVSNERSGDVSVIDGLTNQCIATIPAGKRPRGIHMTPDGRTVYVALSGSPMTGPPPGALGKAGKPAKPPADDDDDENKAKADKAADGIGVIDAAKLTFSHKFPVGSDPEQFALSLDGKHLIIANEDVATASIIDLAQEKVSQLIAVGKEPEGVSVSPDGTFAYVTCEATGDLYAIKLGDATIAAHITTGGRPRSAVFTPDGAKAYVASETNATVYILDTRTQAVATTLKLEGGESVRPMGTAMAQDGKKVYVSTGRGGFVAVIDTATDRLITTIKVGARPWGLAFSPDGTRLYAANGPSNNVSVIDVATQKEVARIAVGASPWGIAVADALK